MIPGPFPTLAYLQVFAAFPRPSVKLQVSYRQCEECDSYRLIWDEPEAVRLSSMELS